MIAIVTGSEIRKNRDGGRNVLMLRVQCGDSDDIQSVEMYCAMGEDFHPPKGTKVKLEEIGAAYKIAIAGDDGIEPSCAVGERKMYSLSGGAPAAIVHWMEDGTLALNNGGGTSVEFGRLKIAFDQLKSDFDNHVHLAGVPLGSIVDSLSGPCTGSTAPPTAASAANIDPAESDTVTLP